MASLIEISGAFLSLTWSTMPQEILRGGEEGGRSGWILEQGSSLVKVRKIQSLLIFDYFTYFNKKKYSER